jgi:hypothetical protein
MLTAGQEPRGKTFGRGAAMHGLQQDYGFGSCKRFLPIIIMLV